MLGVLCAPLSHARIFLASVFVFLLCFPFLRLGCQYWLAMTVRLLIVQCTFRWLTITRCPASQLHFAFRDSNTYREFQGHNNGPLSLAIFKGCSDGCAGMLSFMTILWSIPHYKVIKNLMTLFLMLCTAQSGLTKLHGFRRVCFKTLRQLFPGELDGCKHDDTGRWSIRESSNTVILTGQLQVKTLVNGGLEQSLWHPFPVFIV